MIVHNIWLLNEYQTILMCFLRATNSVRYGFVISDSPKIKLHSDFKKHVAQTTDRNRAAKSQVYNYTTKIQIRWRYKHIGEYFFIRFCGFVCKHFMHNFTLECFLKSPREERSSHKNSNSLGWLIKRDRGFFPKGLKVPSSPTNSMK